MKTLVKLNVLLILVLVLAACAPAGAPTDTPTDVPAVEPAATEAVVVEEATAAPAEVAPQPAVAAGLDLVGTNWVLTSLNGGPALADATVTLQFGADGSATGSDGCNRYVFGFTQDGVNLTFSPAGASTMMMCPEPEGVMEQAAAYAAALTATTNFSGNQSQLALLAGNQIIATFAADVQDLAGSEWDVVQYNNGRMAVVSILNGTELTALFGDTGELSGSAGCNQYIGSYTIDGNTIQIGQLGSTMRLCPEPEGIMEQEQAFMAALQSAATFSIEGDMLQMRTADDALAVVMTRRVEIDLPAPPPEPAVPTGTVVGTTALNIRSGPGTNFPVIGAARAGDQGQLVGRSANGRWWAVALPSAPGGIGWVSADFVLPTNAESVPVIASPPTPVPTATPLPRPTATPAPVQPTATPSADINFSVDRSTINQGECATLAWSVQNVQAVWVYPLGANYSAFPRTGQGSEVVCPATTTTYEMRVRMRDGSTQFRQVTINVNVPQPPPPPPVTNPLANTRWNVVNYNNGQGIVTLLPNTAISVNFGADGQVSGNASCNTFSASYSVNGSAISISQPSSTQQFCPEPEGVMNQEASFLTNLNSAANFSVNGGQLQITSAAGQIVLVATSAP
jgi:heat shock protein HslJ